MFNFTCWQEVFYSSCCHNRIIHKEFIRSIASIYLSIVYNHDMKSSDREILQILKNEQLRQKTQLQMIPSENYASAAVREVVGSILVNKYSEGQPFKRYYQGMKNVDELESLVEKRALKVFKLDPEKWDVNVQPYSGSPANAEIFMA